MKIQLDKTGFPMLWVDEIEAYVNWLPVTKVQFEYFLCDSPGQPFDESWYEQILDLNPRVSPQKVTRRNYWQLLLSGILPDEAEKFAEWCGEGYRVPTLDEWNKIYKSLKGQKAYENLFSEAELKPRIRAVLERIDTIMKELLSRSNKTYTLVDQMLMRYGVMEWVETDNRRSGWGGMGQTDAGLQSMIQTPESGSPEIPRQPTSSRLNYYGFRLIQKEF
jgi:hypothetical protein